MIDKYSFVQDTDEIAFEFWWIRLNSHIRILKVWIITINERRGPLILLSLKYFGSISSSTSKSFLKYHYLKLLTCVEALAFLRKRGSKIVKTDVLFSNTCILFPIVTLTKIHSLYPVVSSTYKMTGKVFTVCFLGKFTPIQDFNWGSGLKSLCNYKKYFHGSF